MTKNKIRVTIAEVGDTSNLFVWSGDKLIAKIWLYPDGGIDYRSFVPKTTRSIRLRGSQIVIEKDIKFNTPPKKIIPIRIKFKLKDTNEDQGE